MLTELPLAFFLSTSCHWSHDSRPHSQLLVSLLHHFISLNDFIHQIGVATEHSIAYIALLPVNLLLCLYLNVSLSSVVKTFQINNNDVEIYRYKMKLLV